LLLALISMLAVQRPAMAQQTADDKGFAAEQQYSVAPVVIKGHLSVQCSRGDGFSRIEASNHSELPLPYFLFVPAYSGICLLRSFPAPSPA
jgi:hypothetical protein